MPSFRIGEAEYDGEQDVQDLLDALQEADEHLMSDPTWQLIRATSETFIGSVENCIQGISAGQLTALLVAIIFDNEESADNAGYTLDEDYDARYKDNHSSRSHEMLFNPKEYFKKFEHLFREEICIDPEEYDGSVFIELLENMCSTGFGD
ncbi:hypothetical protein [Synechococcus sp. 1G10]|uniref:hypothetical protein n=1 Tax=Synechococcus sp. 1G10 TaxID=2025605 RepID=UPI000B97CBFA|nr:hypothetical protein [Synechococcus sp. 1G10]